MKSLEELGEELCEFCAYTEYGEYKANTGPHNLCEGAYCGETYENYIDNYTDSKQREMETIMENKEVIFNKSATIVKWSDGTKTVVKCSESDTFDEEKGFLMAYFQKDTGMSKRKVAEFFKKIGVEK